jgi:trk system potassium uptake protein TrkH
LWRRLTAPQLFAGSFALLIGGGTLGLRLTPAFHAGEPLGWLDSLFTITSAVCVTGLIVVDTATAFTPLGQAWILLFIQLGGLGILTFTTLLTYALGRRLSLRGEALSPTGAEVAPELDLRRLTRDVVLFTLGIEFVGAVVLYGLWAPRLGWRGAAWPAVFHSISAFCNAGFSTFSDSLMGFQRDAVTLLLIAALVVLGGLGFVTLEELYLRWRPRASGRTRAPRLSLHSRIVLATTLVLIVGGWLPMLVLEWGGALGTMPMADRPVNALFMSITPRTAGFNNIDYGVASDATNFLTVLLMTVGGSPGSTAGGLKTTTFALIVLLAWSRFRGHEVTSLWGRSIPEETIQRAVGLAVGVVMILTAGLFVLTVSEDPKAGGDGRFLKYLFETASAFNTVGLSMGITSGLSAVGKLVMIAMMFVGRVGPATAAAALSLSAPTAEGEFRYAYEEVAIG